MKQRIPFVNKIKPTALGLLCFLFACGGSGGSPPVPDVPAANPPHVLFSQSAPTPVLNDPKSEDQFPRDRGFVLTFDLGSPPVTEDAGIRLVNDADSGFPIKTMNYAWMPSMPIHPWISNQQAKACLSFQASVPESVQSGPDRQPGTFGAYLGADFWLTDRSVGKVTSGKTIIASAFFFVDRNGGGRVEDGGPFDYLAPLHAVQFSGSIGQSGFFETTHGALQTVPFGPQDFGFCLSRDQVMFMVAAAHEMLGGVMDIHDIAIKQVVIGNETNLGNPPGHARLVSYFSGVTVYIEQAQLL